VVLCVSWLSVFLENSGSLCIVVLCVLRELWFSVYRTHSYRTVVLCVSWLSVFLENSGSLCIVVLCVLREQWFSVYRTHSLTNSNNIVKIGFVLHIRFPVNYIYFNFFVLCS